MKLMCALWVARTSHVRLILSNGTAQQTVLTSKWQVLARYLIHSMLDLYAIYHRLMTHNSIFDIASTTPL